VGQHRNRPEQVPAWCRGVVVAWICRHHLVLSTTHRFLAQLVAEATRGTPHIVAPDVGIPAAVESITGS
jgi:hypothetical protein